MAEGDEIVEGPPRLRVIRGDATPEELAALVVALAARAAPAPPEPVRARDNWRRPLLRAPLTHGAGAWRASALPH
ncbi:acyl-CoA carboxylase epsilon subunit [Thermopolyspora sp. NPDC052614]|uniref:acyl-CoA carboxylase epsilon subunit n=1 Tax=Thermopolyspora sp. NPDC052614 TaxID=3155682 RepID=UPI00341A84C5